MSPAGELTGYTVSLGATDSGDKALLGTETDCPVIQASEANSHLDDFKLELTNFLQKKTRMLNVTVMK